MKPHQINYRPTKLTTKTQRNTSLSKTNRPMNLTIRITPTPKIPTLTLTISSQLRSRQRLTASRFLTALESERFKNQPTILKLPTLLIIPTQRNQLLQRNRLYTRTLLTNTNKQPQLSHPTTTF